MDIQKRTRIQRDQLADMLENVISTMDVQRQAALELLDTVKQSQDEVAERERHERRGEEGAVHGGLLFFGSFVWGVPVWARRVRGA